MIESYNIFRPFVKILTSYGITWSHQNIVKTQWSIFAPGKITVSLFTNSKLNAGICSWLASVTVLSVYALHTDYTAILFSHFDETLYFFVKELVPEQLLERKFTWSSHGNL